VGEEADEEDDEGEGEQEDDQVGRVEKRGDGKGRDKTVAMDEKREDGGDQLELEEKEKGEGIPAAMIEEHIDLKTTTNIDAYGSTGMIDTILTVLVRAILASVWIAVVLGWVLDRISDVLAFIIELGLVWMPHRDGRL
jgi:hypothetical protein